MAAASVPGSGHTGSLVTVIVALGANALLAAVKSIVAILTGSVSMVAESAHSGADTANEVFLRTAERTGHRPRDAEHPRGYGRSTTPGLWRQRLACSPPERCSQSITVSHRCWAVRPRQLRGQLHSAGGGFVPESISFVHVTRQVRTDAKSFGLRPLRYVNRTSGPTLRAVFLEDLSALLALLIAGVAIAAHPTTRNCVRDLPSP